MKSRTVLILLFLIIGSQFSIGQESEIKKGNVYFDRGEYFRALEYFNKAVAMDPNLDAGIQAKIGRCYYELNDVDNAFTAYSSIEDKLSGDDVFYYASTIHKFGFYEGAIEWYEKSKKEGANPVQIDELIKSCQWASENQQLAEYIVNPTTLFTFGQSFGIQYYRDGVVYSSASQAEGKKVDRQGKEFLDLYYSEIKDGEIQEGARLFSKDLKFEYHIGAISFTSDYKTMYYTKAVRVKGGRSVLKIFSVEFDGQNWKDEIELSINSDQYDVAHPAVSHDDKFLYFVSNKRGGFGGKDLYYAERKKNGSFGPVKNVGNKVNTFGDEVFPFISKENELYFASDGHIGFGGLDLFKAEFVNGKWDNVQNMMKPFNSEKDDFDYVIDPKDDRRGLLSSNRIGKGEDGIFTVVPRWYEKKKEVDLSDRAPIAGLENIHVKEKLLEQEHTPEIVEEPEKPKVDLSKYPGALKTSFTSTFNGTPISGVNVKMTDANTGEVIGQALSNKNGGIEIEIPDKYKNDNQEFVVEMSKGEDYNSKRMIVNIMELEDVNNNGLMMTPIFNDSVLDEISGMVIPYRGNEITKEGKDILDRLAVYLKSNPNIVVKLNGHTEAKGNMITNLNNSQNIADKVEELLIEKGVDDENMIPRGYGERYILNKCKRGVYCNEKEHLKNRRIEVVVWRIKK